jgi:hypothetical protein
MRISRAILAIVLALLTFGCERGTKIRLLNQNPPAFELSGSGRLAMIRVHGQKVRDAAGETGFINWEITPKAGRLNGRLVEEIGRITYGKIPDGYKQIYPSAEESLPALLEGQQYHIFVDTMNANVASMYFEIQDGKVIEIKP